VIVQFIPTLIYFGKGEELIGFGLNHFNLIRFIHPDPAILGVEALLEAILRALLKFAGMVWQFDSFLDVALLDDGSGEVVGLVDVLESGLEVVVAVGSDVCKGLLSGHYLLII
jgi:hypothetical protein